MEDDSVGNTYIESVAVTAACIEMIFLTLTYIEIIWLWIIGVEGIDANSTKSIRDRCAGGISSVAGIEKTRFGLY